MYTSQFFGHVAWHHLMYDAMQCAGMVMCVRVCSNVIDLSTMTAGPSVQCSSGAAAALSPTAVSQSCTSTTPVYEHCGPATSSFSSPPAAERPIPRPRSTYGKYHLKNLKNINADSKPACSLNANDDADDDYDDEDDDDSFCQ